MTMASTPAKIGRSIKNLDNMAVHSIPETVHFFKRIGKYEHQ
jgi:hypothetical protein